MKRVYTGPESSGKSLMLSKRAEEVFIRNYRWNKIVGIPRTMYFNMPMSPDFIDRVTKNGINYKFFSRLEEILFEEECDIFLDELIKFFPASTTSLTQEQLHFLTQGEKSGISVYATTQDFSQVHKQFRRLKPEVYIITKIIGSRRPMKTAPPVTKIWGICSMRKVDPTSFSGEDSTMKPVGLPELFTIKREDTERYDTSYKVPQADLPVKYVRKQKVVWKDPLGGEKVIKEQFI